MNYDALNEAEPAGEVLLRGPQLFSGYYKQVRGGSCRAGRRAESMRSGCL
jgi:hypothetical protein